MGQYGDKDNDYSNDDTEVSVTYKVSSAPEAIRSRQALGANMLLVHIHYRGLCSDILSDLCRSPNTNQPYVYRIDNLPPKYGQMPALINPVNSVTTLIYISSGLNVFNRDTYGGYGSRQGRGKGYGKGCGREQGSDEG